MTRATHHPLDHLMQTANVWLADVRDEFDTTDSDFAYRVTRAWLHALRDRLPVAESAHFAAQLPDVLRGVYYDGWRPSEVPVKCHPEQFIHEVAAAARIAPADLTKVFGSVSDVMDRRLTNLDKVLGSIPAEIRVLIRP